MKNLVLFSLLTLTASLGVLDVPSEPFSYTYEIVSSSRSPSDMTALYYYKEQLIDTYEQYFMNLEVEKIESSIKNSLFMFKFNDDARPYYINGTIVVLLGKAKGVSLKGELRTSECDGTVIREKFYIFDLFS